MDMINAVIQVPSWAYDLCWYYFAIAAVVAILGVTSLVQLFLVPGSVRRFIPTAFLALTIIVTVGINVILALMQFWICRSALRASPAVAKKEQFAVACSSDQDCQAVNGTPQGSTCACGGRGVCGGCVFQNNMEPQPSFSSDFAPFAEGFATALPQKRPTQMNKPMPTRK
jgi:hypothetical protein